MDTIDVTKIMQSFITHINSERNLSFLLGAGISIAFIPAINQITENINLSINSSGDVKKIDAWERLKKEASTTKKRFNIEYVFSSISNKLIAVGNEKLLDMDISELKDFKEYLINFFDDEITKNVQADADESYDSIIENSSHIKFAEWLAQRNTSRGVEVFTPNYDCLLELSFESVKIKYFDGFSGGFIPYFDSSAIENFHYRESDIKLWKIHGSLGWGERKGNIVKLSSDLNKIMVLPSSLKYDETKKLPYSVLLDRLASFLKTKESTMIICGYSFSDNHINEIIINSLKNNKTAQVFAFVYDKKELSDGEECNIDNLKNNANNYSVVKDSDFEQFCKQSNQITIFGFRTVIFRGETYIIKMANCPELPNDDLLYFSYDTEKDNSTGQEKCTGYGELKICNFNDMTVFLKKMAGE